MFEHRRGLVSTSRHTELGRRDDIVGGVGSSLSDIVSGAAAGDTVIPSVSLSDPSSPPTLPSIPLTGLPSFSPLPISSVVSVATNPNLPTISTISLPNDTSSSLLSLHSSSTPSRSSTDSIPPTITSSYFDSSKSSTSGQSSLSDFTTTFTSLSGAIVITVTSVIRPSGSLASTPNTGSDFFHNKAQVGIVFTIVALLVICGFGFLGFRFFKTVKVRQLERDSEDAIRSSRYRIRIDDDDDDDDAGSSNMTEAYHHGFDFLRSGSTEGGHDSENTSYTPSSHSHHLSSTQSSSAFHRISSDVPRPTHSLRKALPDDHLHLPTTTVTGGTENSYLVKRPMRSNSVGTSNLISGAIHRTSSTSTSQSHKMLCTSHESLPPSLPLPEKFGEDGGSVQLPEWDEYEDEYDHTNTGRVLKITNV